MSQPTPVQGTGPVDVNELYRQKGELVTQLEIAQQRLQNINAQISQLINIR